jgi:hypothetical protein
MRSLRGLQYSVNFVVFQESPPPCPLPSRTPLRDVLSFLYALCTFCFTDPTVEDVARATSSNYIPATFSISSTSRSPSDSGASSAAKSSA